MNFTYNALYKKFFLLLFFSFFIFSCTEDKNPDSIERENPISRPDDSVINKEQQEIKEKPKPLVKYHLDSLETQAQADSLKSKLSSQELEIIAALNRIDPWRLDQGQQLVIPDSLIATLKFYAPFPDHLDILDPLPKAVLISKRIQAIALYEKGELLSWGPISSGKSSTETPEGLYYGNYKAREKISTIDSDWIMPFYFNYMNFEGIGTHQYSLPGYPASHGCVRLRREDAQQIYNWADQWKLDSSGQVVIQHGTPFMVYGEYAFDQNPPWQDLVQHPESNFLTPEEERVISGYVEEYVMDPKNADSTTIKAK